MNCIVRDCGRGCLAGTENGDVRCCEYHTGALDVLRMRLAPPGAPSTASSGERRQPSAYELMKLGALRP